MTATRCLVTGAAGFVGAHLCRKLAAEGHDVLALDVRPRPRMLAVEGITFVVRDLRDAGWHALLDGIPTVFHLASVHLQVGSPEHEYRAVNVEASAALTAACRDHGVGRLVHVSTVGIYGHVAHPPASEDAPRRPTNAYERTKLEGEEAVSDVAKRRGVDLRILRPAWVYGPGCPRTAKLLRSIARRRFFYVGDGSNLRHPVYVDDVVAALRLAATAPSGERIDYIIAGPEARTLRQLVDTCASALGARSPRFRLPHSAGLLLGHVAELGGRLVGREPPFSRRSLSFFENDNAFDCRAAGRDLGFRPSVEFAQGIRRTLEDTTWPLAL